MKRLRLHLVALLVSALILGACQGAINPAETQAPAPEETTLVVWDQFYRDVESQVMDTLNKEFEAAHPGVKIERVVKTLDDLKVTLKLALTEANGPDVAQVNQGRSDMGAMVEAGLLLPLDSYLAKYNWSSAFSTSVASRNSFTADGKTFGQGNLYGVSPTAEVVGVYYNKTMFKNTAGTSPGPLRNLKPYWQKLRKAVKLRFPSAVWTVGTRFMNSAPSNTSWSAWITSTT
jgi:ABC-type sugar transport system, periplasmic component